MISDPWRLRLRGVSAVLLLAVFGFCMANVLRERGSLEPGEVARLLPGFLSGNPTAGGDAGDGFREQEESRDILLGGGSFPAPPPPEPMIIVDAGHGGMDGGTQGNGLLEKDWTLEIARALAEDLRQRGFKVKMTRNSDETLELAERAAIANEQRNHLLVSVHLNHSAEPLVSGIETFYALDRSLSATRAVRKQFQVPTGAPLEDVRSELLAEAVQNHVVQVTAANDRRKKERGFYVLRHAFVPAVLVECGFVSNAEEAALIVDGGYRNRLARGIANGITSFLNAVESDPLYGVTVTPVLPEAPEELVSAR